MIISRIVIIIKYLHFLFDLSLKSHLFSTKFSNLSMCFFMYSNICRFNYNYSVYLYILMAVNRRRSENSFLQKFIKISLTTKGYLES